MNLSFLIDNGLDELGVIKAGLQDVVRLLTKAVFCTEQLAGFYV